MVYDKAIRPDGSLLFPERLSEDFLREQRRSLGSYIYANQYMNEIIPDDQKAFKESWIRYYDSVPINHYTFAFVDPAISQQKNADYTAYVVVNVDSSGKWYIEAARRMRITGTETIELLFDIYDQYAPMCIGLELVGYQNALMHFLNEEMNTRQKVIPVKGIRRGTDKTKEARILSLVPRFEWGKVFLSQGLLELEDELSKFPRGRYDDILDALQSIEDIVYYPMKDARGENEPAPNHPEYERHYIRKLNEQLKAEAGEAEEKTDSGYLDISRLE